MFWKSDFLGTKIMCLLFTRTTDNDVECSLSFVTSNINTNSQLVNSSIIDTDRFKRTIILTPWKVSFIDRSRAFPTDMSHTQARCDHILGKYLKSIQQAITTAGRSIQWSFLTQIDSRIIDGSIHLSGDDASYQIGLAIYLIARAVETKSCILLYLICISLHHFNP